MTDATSHTTPTRRTFAGERVTIVGDERGAPGGPAAVLIHGGGQTRHSWDSTAVALAQRGWRTVTVDLRGHGDSGWPDDGDYTLDAFAADVRAVAGTFDRPPVVVGASLGGLASLIAIAESAIPEPVATGLVLVDVAPRVEQAGVKRIGAFMTANPDGFASLEEVADAVAAYNPHRPRPTNLSGLERNLRRRHDGRWVWHWDPRFVSGARGSDDETRSSDLTPADRLADAAQALTLPVLLVRGRMSDLLSEEGAKDLQRLVPHARLVDVAGAGHMVAGDRNDLFNDAIVEFLSDVWGAQAETTQP